MRTLIPLCIFVGIYDVLNAEPSIVNDYLVAAKSGMAPRIILAILISAAIGFVDVLCFAWPIADLCRTIGKRTEKFVAPGFHIVMMKSYALSHLVFLPFLVLTMSTGLRTGSLSPEAPLYLFAANLMMFWQLAILLRTISVKSKLELPGRLMMGAVIYLWTFFEGAAVSYLLQLAHQLFGMLVKIS